MSLILAHTLAERYRRRLAEVGRDHPTAASRGETECRRSGVCCWVRPCELGPGDPERLAAHLGVSVAELFLNYLVVDRFSWGLGLLPRRAEQEGGQFLSDRETWDCDTPCVFLADDHSCRVHDAKPAGGRQFGCWMPDRASLPHYPWSRESLLALGWSGDDD